MSIEKDYSSSYESDANIISVLRGLMTNWHLKIEILKKDLAEISQEDIEYIHLYLDELNFEIYCLLQKRVDSLNELVEIKKKDFEGREE